MSILVFRNVCRQPLCWARLIQSIPSNNIFLRPILLLSSHLGLGFSSGLFPSVFQPKFFYAFPIFPTCALCPAHLSLIDFTQNKKLNFVLYTLISIILDSKREDKWFWNLWYQAVPEFSVFIFFRKCNLICYRRPQIFEFRHILEEYILAAFIAQRFSLAICDEIWTCS
jgi:hypothetical protein